MSLSKRSIATARSNELSAKEAPDKQPKLSHAAIESKPFLQCFEDPIIKQQGTSRLRIQVYATCRNAQCKAAEASGRTSVTQRNQGPGESIAPRSEKLKDFDVQFHTGKAIQKLIEKHQACFAEHLDFEALKKYDASKSFTAQARFACA